MQQVQDTHKEPKEHPPSLRSNQNKRATSQQPPRVECDPSLHQPAQGYDDADVGILDCGVGAYCMESTDSVLGGYCVGHLQEEAVEVEHDNLRRPTWFSVSRRYADDELAECDPLDTNSSCDPGQECVEDPVSAMGGLCVDYSRDRPHNPFPDFRRRLQAYPYTMFFDFI